ncbi:MAG: hypothetical protein U1E26_07970 [Coriobacteriia bacterium]|nr:hypothetical protein [Coriobacteriia bacterium]
MSVLTLTLGDGRRVWASRYVVSDTWAGFLAWSNQESTKLTMISSTYEEAAHTFGDRMPLLVIVPECEAKDIPGVRVMACLESQPLDPARDGSALVCAWFQESASLVPDEIGAGELGGIDWEQQADDFNF